MSEIKKTDERMEAMRQRLVGQICAYLGEDGVAPTSVPGLSLYRRSAMTSCTPTTYMPQLIVFLQGEKQVQMGGVMHQCRELNYLLTSVELPVVSQVTCASIVRPILGLMIDLEMQTVREILSREELCVSGTGSGAQGMSVGECDAELLEACGRLLNLLDSEQDAPFLGELVQREILYRLLRGPQGRNLRAIATLGEQSNRTARAVAWLKENFSRPLRIEELAEVAQMGVSTLHHHFRSLTAMSPLQYQKQLRLQRARQRMLTDGLDAASAAFEVGYESPSQFSREYRRFFGQPPIRDVKARRMGGESALEA